MKSFFCLLFCLIGSLWASELPITFVNHASKPVTVKIEVHPKKLKSIRPLIIEKSLKLNEPGTIIFPKPEDNRMVIIIDTISPHRLSISNDVVMQMMPATTLEITDQGIPQVDKLETEAYRKMTQHITPNQQLLNAFEKSSLVNMRRALENGADPNIRGSQLFNYEINAGNIDAVRLFVQHNVRINDQDSEGFTSLMVAVKHAIHFSNSDSTEILKILIAALKKGGESLDLYNNENKTAYWIAHEAKRPGIERLLVDAGANPWLSPAEVKRLKPAKLKEWERENEMERKKRNEALIEQGKPEEQAHIPADVLELIGKY